jgi:hypothetical protein
MQHAPGLLCAEAVLTSPLLCILLLHSPAARAPIFARPLPCVFVSLVVGGPPPPLHTVCSPLSLRAACLRLAHLLAAYLKTLPPPLLVPSPSFYITNPTLDNALAAPPLRSNPIHNCFM